MYLTALEMIKLILYLNILDPVISTELLDWGSPTKAGELTALGIGKSVESTAFLQHLHSFKV